MSAKQIPPNGNGRLKYERSRYVNRPGTEPDTDQIVADIYNWVDRRLSSVAPPIYRLEAPPGFGKTWALHHFIELHRNSFGDKFIIMGPLTPPEAYTPEWWKERVQELIAQNGRAIEPNSIHYRDDIGFQGYLYTLIEDLEASGAMGHLLFIVDDVDQAPDSIALVNMLLEPIVDQFTRHAVSLLLGLRSDFSFPNLRELKSERRYQKGSVQPFVPFQARQQVESLLPLFGVADDPQITTDGIVESFAGGDKKYTWGIPALNAELVRTWRDKAFDGEPIWKADEVETCVLLALRLDPAADREFLRNAIRLRNSAYPSGWVIKDARLQLGWSTTVASDFRNRLKQHNLFEPPAVTSYRYSQDWDSVFEVCHELSTAMSSPTRGTQ